MGSIFSCKHRHAQRLLTFRSTWLLCALLPCIVCSNGLPLSVLEDPWCLTKQCAHDSDATTETSSKCYHKFTARQPNECKSSSDAVADELMKNLPTVLHNRRLIFVGGSVTHGLWLALRRRLDTGTTKVKPRDELDR
jgi:hypothetical protein